MKRLKNFLLLFLLLASLMPPSHAQDVTTQGTEFWVSFMSNGYKDRWDETWLRIQLLISAKDACSCTITNPRTGWQRSFDLEANSAYLLDEIEEQQAYIEMYEAEMVMDKGLLITATDTVSVYCSNIAVFSFDVSYVMPTESLSDDYIIQTPDQTNNRDIETSAFLIVATEDNTTIDITPACSTLRERPAGETFTITMDKGQCFQVRSNKNYTESRDLSGSRVTARDCKKIAVFNGSNLTGVPLSSSYDFDCVFEQAMPVHSWGKHFIVTSSLDRDQDYVKITSSTDNNEILKNGQPLCTLNATQSYTFPISNNEKSCYLEANGSCAVHLYNMSAPNHSIGAPSMVWIAPLEQRIDEITFSTFNYEHPEATIHAHYINIIVHKDDVGQVYLDGALLPVSQFETVTGNDDYCFYRNSIQHGAHHLACEKGFNAHVYGFGEARGYAYMVGSKAKPLNSSIFINDLAIMPHDDFQYCVDEPITFEAEVSLQNYTLLWDFGDGTTSTENPVTHTYNDKRIYTAMLIVNAGENGCQPAATDTTLFYIDATQQYIIKHEDICAGELYTGYGFTDVPISNDTILSRVQDNPLHPICQDSLLVYVTVHSPSHTIFDDSRCWHGQPWIYDDHGFRFVYEHPGVFDRHLDLQTLYGCDSIIDLHLTVADQITHEFEHNECSNSYVWDGTTYNVSGIYEKTYVSSDGCDSIVTLHLNLGLPQHTSFDTITCGTFHWNGQDYTIPGDYQQQFTTADGCDSIVDCHLTFGSDVEGTTTEVSGCDSYYWLGTNYTVSGFYDKTLSAISGCDSIVHLNLSLEYAPDPTDIYPADPNNTAPHWVVTTTDFEIQGYEFMLKDNNPACHWDTVVWRFEDDIPWELEPLGDHGSHCKVYVLHLLEDTVWLNARVYNDCFPEGIERRFWLVSSFYGIEDGPSTGSATAHFEVVPNPNNGLMTLHFEHITGRLELSVYDMLGTLIYRMQIENVSESRSLPYQLNARASGIYCFVLTGKEGIMTKKVIVTP